MGALGTCMFVPHQLVLLWEIMGRSLLKPNIKCPACLPERHTYAHQKAWTRMFTATRWETSKAFTHRRVTTHTVACSRTGISRHSGMNKARMRRWLGFIHRVLRRKGQADTQENVLNDPIHRKFKTGRRILGERRGQQGLGVWCGGSSGLGLRCF